MKRFDAVKTVQLLILAALTVIGLGLIFRDDALYAQMAANASVRRLGVLLWLTLGSSFLFLFYDFNSYSELRRENTELDNAVYSDALTGVANRYSVDLYIARYQDRPLPADMGCVTLELTNLSEINAALGHSAGDEAIQSFSEVLLGAADGACFIGRNGGNKFVAIFHDCSQSRLDRFLKAVEHRSAESAAANPAAAVRYSVGVAFDEGEDVKSLAELMALSDRRVWQRQ